jgi:uncharacterized membrane protein
VWETEAHTEIAASADRVYAYLADFPRHSEWSRGVASIEPVTDGTTAVGTEFKATETVPMKFVSYSRITTLEPDRRIAWDAWDGRTMKARWSFELTPTAGGTRVVQRCGFEPTNLIGRVMLTVMRRHQVPKENRQSLERIKSTLERGA